MIIAPHPDDELWLLNVLKKGVDEVIYVTETDGGRDLEAIRLAQHLRFRPVFCHGLEGLSTYLSNLDNTPDTVIYIPEDIPGDHPMHRLVARTIDPYQLVRKYTIYRYRIDINNITGGMKKYIKDFYPSQRWLLDEEERI